MVKPIKVDLPYPDLSGIEKDLVSAEVISSAYAGNHSELSAIMQYVYHNFYFKSYDEEEIADILIGISLTEMEHLEILGNLLLKLGVDPVYTNNPPYKYNFFSTSCIQYSKNCQKMLLDDISGEMVAVESYEQMLKKLTQESVSAVISRILLDEELHIKILKNQLEKCYLKK